MTVRRGLLYTGVFLLAAGGVVLLAQAGTIDAPAVRRAMSLWPLAVIAIGAGLILRRTRVGVPGGLVAALMPGLLFGGMIATIPDLPRLGSWAAPCGAADGAGTVGVDAGPERTGTFGTTAKVDLSLACGGLVVTTGPGSTWQFGATDARRGDAVVSDAPDRLSIRSEDHHRLFDSQGRGSDWRLQLPVDTLLDIDAEMSAGEARLALEGARIGTFRLQLNAGATRLDAAGATVSRLEVEVNAGSVTVLLPATGDMTGALEANAGSIDVCAPAGLGLRVRGESALGTTTFNGLVQVGNAWESSDYASAPFHADLAVSANVGSVVINPEGGCL
jgi:hypothetical protein